MKKVLTLLITGLILFSSISLMADSKIKIRLYGYELTEQEAANYDKVIINRLYKVSRYEWQLNNAQRLRLNRTNNTKAVFNYIVVTGFGVSLVLTGGFSVVAVPVVASLM